MLQKLVDKARDEIAFAWMTVLVIVTTLQVEAVDLPRAVHIAVALVTAVLAAWGIRTGSTPNTKVAA